MHHAPIVVDHPVIGNRLVVVFIKVILLARLNVVPDDRYPLVAIGGALLVIKAERMHELVDDGTVAQTARILEVYHLALTMLANIGPASGALALDSYEVLVAFLVGAETHTRLAVVVFQRGLDFLDLYITYKIHLYV